MRFTAVLASSAAVSGALAGLYAEEPVYTTVDDKVYTSVKTCTDKPYEPTMAPVYEPAPTEYPASEVTYTSYEKVTVTSCGDYVTNCPAEVYTSTAYSVSTCVPATTDYYVPPANTTDYYVPPAEYPTETPEYPAEYPTETAYPTETHTYYTTVCPQKEYCYATTVTSTYCPGKPTETPYVPEEPTYVPTYSHPAPEPTHPAPVCPGGYDCPAEPSYVPVPPMNETTYVPPPSYTGAAVANGVSFGALAAAGLALLFAA
jgi:hypothetical protein